MRHQKPHIRISRKGKKFRAGKGSYKSHKSMFDSDSINKRFKRFTDENAKEETRKRLEDMEEDRRQDKRQEFHDKLFRDERLKSILIPPPPIQDRKFGLENLDIDIPEHMRERDNIRGFRKESPRKRNVWLVDPAGKVYTEYQ